MEQGLMDAIKNLNLSEKTPDELREFLKAISSVKSETEHIIAKKDTEAKKERELKQRELIEKQNANVPMKKVSSR